MLKPEVLDIPDQSGIFEIDQITFIDSSLYQIIHEYDIIDIRRAFPDFKLADTTQVSRTGRTYNVMDRSRIFLIRTKNDRKKLIEDLNSLESVVYSEPNSVVADYHSSADSEKIQSMAHGKTDKNMGIQSGAPKFFPNDEFFDNQLSMYREQNREADISAPEAWQIYTGSKDITIGIVGNGRVYNHDDFTGRLSGSTSGSVSSNATNIAGIAGATGNNITGVAGVDWKAQLKTRHGSSFAEKAQAIHDIINDGVDVISNSWYAGNAFNITVADAFAAAAKAGVLSANVMYFYILNDFWKYPSKYAEKISGIINVSGTDFEAVVRDESMPRDWVHVAAPGWGGIYTTTDDNNYQSTPLTPNVYAVPHVAGIASLLKGYAMEEHSTTLHKNDLKHLIMKSARKVQPAEHNYNSEGFSQRAGYGLADAYEALKLLDNPYVLEQSTANGGTVQSSTGFYSQSFYGAPGLSDGFLYQVRRHEVHHTINYSELNRAC